MEDSRNNLGGQVKPPNTLLREQVMQINGQEVISESEAYVKKEDGSIVRQVRTNCRMAADGRWLRMDDFGGTSYTGLDVPKDRVSYCLNPFEDHGARLVYIGIDGLITELGNVLCTECIEHQRRRQFWKNVLLFGAIYNPEDY